MVVLLPFFVIKQIIFHGLYEKASTDSITLISVVKLQRLKRHLTRMVKLPKYAANKICYKASIIHIIYLT